MDIVYQQVAIYDVMSFFAKSYAPLKGAIIGLEWFVDTAKGVVIFKLTVDGASLEKTE